MQTKIFLILPELLKGIDIKYMEEGVNDGKKETLLSTIFFPNSTGLSEYQISCLDPYAKIGRDNGYSNNNSNNNTPIKGLSTHCGCGISFDYTALISMSHTHTLSQDTSKSYTRTLISDSMVRITDFKINDITEILKENIGKCEYIVLDYNQFVTDLLKRECIFFYVVVPSHGLISVLSNNQNENNKDLTKYKNRVSIRNGKNSDTIKLDNLTKLTNKINCEKQYGFGRLSTDISDIILFLKEFKKTN